jgi:hypothetical protein
MTDALDDSEHEHHPDAWDKHRGRFAPRRLKIHGHSLATWAAQITAHEAARITSEIKIGISAGESNTDIAHRIIGSARLNGGNGATEITRQQILRLGKGYLRRRKTRMGEVVPDVRHDDTEKTQ